MCRYMYVLWVKLKATVLWTQHRSLWKWAHKPVKASQPNSRNSFFKLFSPWEKAENDQKSGLFPQRVQLQGMYLLPHRLKLCSLVLLQEGTTQWHTCQSCAKIVQRQFQKGKSGLLKSARRLAQLKVSVLHPALCYFISSTGTMYLPGSQMSPWWGPQYLW